MQELRVSAPQIRKLLAERVAHALALPICLSRSMMSSALAGS
jgi:hypothetical protein